jgi:hypothetical protein
VSYNGRGVAKQATVKATHAIIYTGTSEPLHKKSKIPRANQSPMITGIRIIPIDEHNTLHPMSRLDFGRMYHVEHHMEVLYYGNVEKEFMEILTSRWIRGIAQGLTEGFDNCQILRRGQAVNKNTNAESVDDNGKDDNELNENTK